MLPEKLRSRRVLAICDELVATQAECRAEVLSRLCTGDPPLRAEVESVLQAIEDSGDFLSADDKRFSSLFYTSLLSLDVMAR